MRLLPERSAPSNLLMGVLVASVLALVSSPVIARALGPEGRGEVAATVALGSLLPILLGLGLPLEVRRFVATTGTTKIGRPLAIYCAATGAPALIVSAVCFLTLFSGFEAKAQVAALACTLVAPLGVNWIVRTNILVAVANYRAVFWLRIIQPATFVALVVLLWALGKASVAGVLWSSAAGTIATFLLALIFTSRGVTGSEPASLGALVKGGSRFAGSSIAEAASSKVDQVIALPLLGAYQAGLYSVAATVAMVPTAVAQALAAAEFRKVAKAADGEVRAAQARAVRLGLALGLTLLPLGLIATVVGVPVIFGAAFAAAVLPACIYMLGSVVFIGVFPASMALAAVARGVAMTVCQFLGLAVSVALLFALGPPLGARGAALASSVGYVVLLGLLGAALGLKFRAIIPRPGDIGDAVKTLLRSDRG